MTTTIAHSAKTHGDAAAVVTRVVARDGGDRAGHPHLRPASGTDRISEAARQAAIDRRNFQRLLRWHQTNPRDLKR
jgi:hypothetical protein